MFLKQNFKKNYSRVKFLRRFFLGSNFTENFTRANFFTGYLSKVKILLATVTMGSEGSGG